MKQMNMLSPGAEFNQFSENAIRDQIEHKLPTEERGSLINGIMRKAEGDESAMMFLEESSELVDANEAPHPRRRLSQVLNYDSGYSSDNAAAAAEFETKMYEAETERKGHEVYVERQHAAEEQIEEHAYTPPVETYQQDEPKSTYDEVQYEEAPPELKSAYESVTCQCEGGQPVSDEECATWVTRTHMGDCATCNHGFTMWNGWCRHEYVACDHGYTDGTSTYHQGCAGCHDGYHLQNKMCTPNVCRCENGTPAHHCMQNDAHMCEVCHQGYQLNDQGHCEPKTCTCAHGPAAEGADCDGGHACSTCNQGFSFLGATRVCAQNCVCQNGVPPTDGCDPMKPCAQCNRGFTLTVDQRCVPSQCSCNNGTGYSGNACPGEGAERCETCNTNYVKTVNDRCIPTCAIFFESMTEQNLKVCGDGMKRRVMDTVCPSGDCNEDDCCHRPCDQPYEVPMMEQY